MISLLFEYDREYEIEQEIEYEIEFEIKSGRVGTHSKCIQAIFFTTKQSSKKFQLLIIINSL